MYKIPSHNICLTHERDGIKPNLEITTKHLWASNQVSGDLKVMLSNAHRGCLESSIYKQQCCKNYEVMKGVGEEGGFVSTFGWIQFVFDKAHFAHNWGVDMTANFGSNN